MKVYLLATIFSLLFLSGCTHASTPTKDANALSCKVKDNYVVVKFSNGGQPNTRNPKFFGISRGSNFIYLNYPSAHAYLTQYNSHTKILNLNIKMQTGILYKDGTPSRVLVFSKPGIYDLLFTDNIETEPENTYSLRCGIKIHNLY